jgi:hypothetical protein
MSLIGRVLGEMGIPHAILIDSDRGRRAAMDNAQIRRDAGGAPVFELQPDFEGAAGIRNPEDKVLEAWQRFSKIDAERIPDVFKRIVDTTVRLAHGGQAEN